MKTPIKTLLLLLCCINLAFAYKPDTGHALLTAHALSYYKQCFKQDSFYDNKVIQDNIVLGTKALDEGLKGSSLIQNEGYFSPIYRAFNWHFFNPNKEHLSRKYLIFKQSYTNLWDGIYQGFELNSKIKDKALFIGGILHLLEDTTVPAHIIPVYHGPTAVKYFGFSSLTSYMQDETKEDMIEDKIDAYEVNISIKDLEGICKKSSAPQTLKELRIDNFNYLTSLLKTSISEKCSKKKWNSFWNNPKEDKYFGKYNLAQPLFGEKGTIDGCEIKENDPLYKSFVKKLHIKAIETDIRALRWFSLKMGNNK